VVALGIGNLFWTPLIRIIGKRPIYLASLLGVVVTNIWGYYAHSYSNLLISRIAGGFLSAVSDVTVPSIVADLFYFHERGHFMMIFHVFIQAGGCVGSMINSFIVQYWGWRYLLLKLAETRITD
jgi:MFS family permease